MIIKRMLVNGLSGALKHNAMSFNPSMMVSKDGNAL